MKDKGRESRALRNQKDRKKIESNHDDENVTHSRVLSKNQISEDVGP